MWLGNHSHASQIPTWTWHKRAAADVGNPRRVFVIGPVTGATVAAAYYKVINAMQDKEAENEPAADRADDVKPVEA